MRTKLGNENRIVRAYRLVSLPTFVVAISQHSVWSEITSHRRLYMARAEQ